MKLPVPRTFELTHVEPTHYAVALGKDPVKIFEFVRDQIGYEVYTGVLRGPRGTLLAMAGNSVDRAALLASLLEQSGQKIRFARGTLPEARARDLVMSMWTEHRQAAAAVADSNVTEAAKAASNTLTAGIRRDFTLIQDQLQNVSPPGSRDPTISVDALVKEAQTHYWVQWLKDGAWVDLDPSFAAAAPGRAHTRGDDTYTALPDSLHHRVTVRIKLEEYAILLNGNSEGSPTVREILSYTVKAAGLSGTDLVLTHQPENWTGPATSLETAISSAVSSTGLVKPVLVTGPEKWMTGTAFRQKLPSSGGLGGLSDMLGGAGTRKPVAIATAESVELDFIDPTGRSVRVVREIFDIVGKARRAAGGNLNHQEVRDRVGAKTAGVANEAVYALFFATGHIAGSHLMNIEDTPQRSGTPPDVRSTLRQIAIGFVAASDGMTKRIGRSERAIVLFYPDSPRLLIVELASMSGKERVALDLRRDHARAVVTGSRREDVFPARVLRGVVNGTVERVWMEYLAGQQPESAVASSVSTSTLFERAAVENVRPVLLPRDRDRLDPGLPPDTAARLREEQTSGQLALAPQRAIVVDSVPRLAWWRIHPRSGETVAVTDEGLHAIEASLVRYQGTQTVQVLVRSVVGSTVSRWFIFTTRSPAALAWALRVLQLLGGRVVSDITSSQTFH